MKYWSPWTHCVLPILLVVSALLLLGITPQSTRASEIRPATNDKAAAVISLPGVTVLAPIGGDFRNVDFVAAAPETYTHATGGGAYNDRTIGITNDVTTQLLGGNFTCSDIVTYLLFVEMEGDSTVVDLVQTAEFDLRFLANSTGQAGAAISDIVFVGVNYGSVENGDDGTGVNPGEGSFGLDSGISDDGGSTAILTSQTLTGPLFNAGSELLGTVLVDDLEGGESIVIRIDVRLSCDPGSNPTGNLQAQLDNGTAFHPDTTSVDSSSTINTGQQTIPFLQIGDISGAGDALLAITKTVTTNDGTCGVNDVDSLGVTAGDTVKYCYELVNSGTADLFDVEVTDDNGTPSTGDDFTVSIAGLQDLDSQGDLGDLAAGDTALGEALVVLNTGGTVINVATATGNNGLPGGQFLILTEQDSATVTVEGLGPVPSVLLEKSSTFNDEGNDGFADAGETISYNFKVTNTGGVTLTDISVTDSLVASITCPGGNPIPSLAPDSMATCTGSYTLTQADVDAGQRDNTALASGSDPGGDPVEDDDDDSEDLPQNPSVLLEKSSTFNDEGNDGFADEDETISYSFKVTNTGNVTLTDISVTDSLVASITCPGGNPIPSLAPDSMATCTGSYTLTQADVDAGQRDNTALASGSDPGGDPVEDDDDDSEDLPQNPSVLLEKSSTFNDEGNDGFADEDETISYSFKVTNTGNVTLTDISVTDSLVASITCPGGNPIPSLAPDSMATCTGSYTLTQADVDAGQRDNTALASGSDPGGDPVEDDDDDSEDLPQNPSVLLEKSSTFNDEGNDGFADEDETISYSFKVTNTGNVTLTDISVTDSLVASITCPGGNPIPSLAPDSMATCTGSYALTQADVDAGKRDNTALASGSDPGGDPVEDDDDDSEPLEQDKMISLVKTGSFNDEGGDGFADAGETISYSFKVTNSGNVTLTNISVTDSLVASITCPGGNPIPSLAPDSMATCTGSYALTQADVDAGQRDNTALAAGSDPGGDPVEDDDDHSEDLPQNPSVLLEKSSTFNDEGGDGFAQPDETISYSFKVTNTGNVTLTDISVTDSLVASITCPGGNPIPSLAPDSMATCTGSYTLTQADVDAGQRDNTALAAGSDPGGDPVEDDDVDSEDLPQNPLIGIVKEVCDSDPGSNTEAVCENDGTLKVLNGSEVYYRLTVTNLGNVTLTNIGIVDPQVDMAACVVTDPLAPGGSFVCVVGPETVQLSVDLSTGAVNPFVNTATASGDDPGGTPLDSTDTASYSGLFIGYTIGFWRNHTDLWCDAYQPDTPLSEVFGTNIGGTLEDALRFRGGNKEKIVLRSATATLLTACSLEQLGLIPPVGPDYIYPYTTVDVIAIVNQAIVDGRKALQELNPILNAINKGIEDKCLLEGTCSLSLAVGKVENLTMEFSATAVIPEEFGLDQNYPNPFNPATTIGFQLPEASEVRLSVYDVLGRHVLQLVNESMKAGIHSVQWNAESLPSGLYFFVMQAGEFKQVRQMILMK